MKVKELIEMLTTLDPELDVVLSTFTGGLIDTKGVGVCSVRLNANDEWYKGPHEVVAPEDEEAVKVVYIS